MALKACPRCGRFIPQGMAYCTECAPIAEASRREAIERKIAYKNKKYNQKYNQKRAKDDPKYRQFRNSKQWRELSRAKLQACGYKCEAHLEGCKRIACEVHHIEPIKTTSGWDKRFDWDNLKGVCIHCHNILDNKFYKGKYGADVLDMKKISEELKQEKEPEPPGVG